MWVEIMMKHALPSKRCINAIQNTQVTCSDTAAAITITFYHTRSFPLHLFHAHVHLDMHTQLSTLVTSSWFG